MIYAQIVKKSIQGFMAILGIYVYKLRFKTYILYFLNIYILNKFINMVTWRFWCRGI